MWVRATLFPPLTPALLPVEPTTPPESGEHAALRARSGPTAPPAPVDPTARSVQSDSPATPAAVFAASARLVTRRLPAGSLRWWGRGSTSQRHSRRRARACCSEVTSRSPPGPSSTAAVSLDPADPETWRTAVRTCADRFGAPPDLLVTGTPPTSVHALTAEQLWAAYAGGAVGLLHGIQAVAPGMRAAERGAVVAITAPAGGPCSARVATAATVALVRCAALDLGRHRIRVNAVEPGSAPLESVACTALFLASDESSWITGTAVSAGRAFA
ncbi:SDR family oxidoreductase [Pseudonocardia kujensis]|uniref:SDR family oxidoreductase n=1 Tax=Pseudonocardia kujensis TaxID=1128675 RepID=UPI001E32873A|nr:SDR family oxidoreductase [Pseudonocardia kujensis]MCE0763503.1 SDR family oxidoreductase [Pseudonocardia kujensis]